MPSPPVRPADIRARREALRNRPQVPLLRLFVASSSDVVAERERVRQVVNRLHARIGTRVRIDVVMWEDYDTPDWKPPQDAIFGSTRFDEIDLFVGIFWWRAGTPTGTRDAQGHEFPGGTFAELHRARELHRASGGLPRMMVYFCERPLPPAADPEQHRHILALRSEMEAGPDRAFPRTYTGVDEFEARLAHHLSDVLDDFLEAQPGQAPVGDLVTKLCDRYDQEAEFADFFTEGLAEHPGVPQACLLWGEAREGHESLVERLIATRVKRAAARRWPEGGGTVADYQPEWPDARVGDDPRRRLQRMLFDQFDPEHPGRDRSAAEITGLPSFRRARLVVLHHNVYLSKWTAATGRLIEWYLDGYWKGLPPDPERPEVLIFLKLIYGAPRDQEPTEEALEQRRDARRRMGRELRALCERSEDGCRRILLPELEPVRSDHVKEWLEKHASVAPASRARQLAEELFRADGRILESRSMDEVETDLRELLPQLGAL